VLHGDLVSKEVGVRVPLPAQDFEGPYAARLSPTATPALIMLKVVL
jgi:hypothetical protein